ncbi:MAG: hypothetical protein K2M68_10125, partial [Muribaculaceae bacterium]|nr:hypothetical protein [Muribaculaceae bacterium]
LTLSRGAEMGLGAFVPVLLLTIIEIWLAIKGYEDPRYAIYKSISHKAGETDAATIAAGNKANRFTRRVLGLSISLAGVLISLLGLMADSSGYIPLVMGLIVLTVGLIIRYKK